MPLGRDAARTTVVVVTTPDPPNWTFAAPFGCGSVAQCGFVHVVVEPVAGGPALADVAAAGRAISVPLNRPGFVEGAYRFRAELRREDGMLESVVVNGSVQHFADDVVVDVRRSCGGDAGAPDASTDAAADGSREAGPRDAAPDGPPRDAAPDGPGHDGRAPAHG